MKTLKSKCSCLPSEIALTRIMKAKMKMISDALLSRLIIFLTTCCPTSAATVATTIKYRAASITRNSNNFMSKLKRSRFCNTLTTSCIVSQLLVDTCPESMTRMQRHVVITYHMLEESVSEDNTESWTWTTKIT